LELKFKTCKHCGELKSVDDFYGQNKIKANGEKYIYYPPECKDCNKEKSEQWRKDPKNRETFLESKRKRNKHPDHKKELQRAYERRSKEGYFLEYYQGNKDKFKQYRDFRKQHKEHDITEQEWLDCLSYFNDSCAYCGLSEKDVLITYNQLLHKDHVDHFGSNDITNCVPACKSCNSQKWEFEFNEWYNENNSIFSKRRYNKIIKWLLSFVEVN
jgi:hypothetical protein